MDVNKKLDQLDDYMAQKTIMELDKKALIDAVYTPEIRKAIQDIDDEFEGKAASVDQNIETLTAEIKNDVLNAGETIKGAHLMAVLSKGRTTWDTKALDGILVVHPELAPLRKIGDPSVSIRRI